MTYEIQAGAERVLVQSAALAVETVDAMALRFGAASIHADGAAILYTTAEEVRSRAVRVREIEADAMRALGLS